MWGRPRAAPSFGFPCTSHLWPGIQRLCAAGGSGKMLFSLPPGRLQPATQPPPPHSSFGHRVSVLWWVRRPFYQPLLPSPYSPSHRVGVLELAPSPHLGTPSSHGSLRSAGVELAHGRGLVTVAGADVQQSYPTRAAPLC